MSRKLITILVPDLQGGGTERVSIDLACEFARAGHDIDFVLMRARGELLQEARSAFRIIDLNVPRARETPLALARYFRKRRPHAVLAALWPLTVIAPVARQLSEYRFRVVVSEHAVLSEQYRTWGRPHDIALRASIAFGYRLADARVGVSTGVAKDMASLAKMPVDQFTVIHNPIPKRLRPSAPVCAAAEALWGVRPGKRILTVGRFKAEKNHRMLLRSFALTIAPGARLMLVGNGSGEAMLRAQAKELGIADQVIFAGFRADPTPFYATADLFVLSSNHEGFGNVIVEALAFGLPVVSTDCPTGPAEILDRGRFGRLVPVGDEVALAEAMAAALTEPHDRRLLKARANDFTPPKAAKTYLGLLFDDGER